MKKALIGIIATIMAVITMFSLTACQNRTKKDISKATSVADLEGAKISAQAGTFHEKARDQIKNVKGQVYKDFDTMFVALNSGAIDGYIAEEPTALKLSLEHNNIGYLPFVNNQNGFKATYDDTAIAMGFKKGTDWASRINPVLEQISNENRIALMNQCARVGANLESVEKYVVSNDAPATTTGTLKVAMECAYAPFNWTQTDNKNGAVPIYSKGSEGLFANGFDVQIAKYVANALGLKLEIYACEWDSLIPGIQSETYDLIAAGMSPTADRRAEVDFTTNYYSSNLVVIYKKA